MVRYQFGGESELSNAPMSMSLLGKLQRDILTGKYRPGQKLTEQNLCKEYGVSRTPIREALRQLETDGLVENILNRGCFVIGFSEQDYEDLFDLRKAYEIQAVKWAIERATEEEIERLDETFEFMEFYTMRNDIEKMLAALHTPACPGKPRLILMHTLKGKGVSFMEGQVGWHGKAPNDEQTAIALKDLEG